MHVAACTGSSLPLILCLPALPQLADQQTAQSRLLLHQVPAVGTQYVRVGWEVLRAQTGAQIRAVLTPPQQQVLDQKVFESLTAGPF